MDDNIFSIDRLIEFGISMSIANQMATSMNQTYKNIEVPGARKPMLQKMESAYYVVIDDEQCGPYSLADISKMIREKKIVKETYMWKPGMAQWELAENIDEVLTIVALTPPPVPNND